MLINAFQPRRGVGLLVVLAKVLLLRFLVLEAVAVEQDETNITDASLQISYVLEPFERLDTGTWLTFPEEKEENDLYATTRSAEFSILHGEQALFGNGSLLWNFSMANASDDATTTTGVGSILKDRPYNCYGATYLSLWWKIHVEDGLGEPFQQKQGRDDIAIHLSLYDDTECFLQNNTAPCNQPEDLTAHLVHVEMAAPTTNATGKGEEWTEIQVPLYNLNDAYMEDDMFLDTRRIRGFRIDVITNKEATSAASITKRRSATTSMAIQFDQLACHGGGDLLGASLHLGPRFDYEDAIAQDNWREDYYQSVTSQNLTHVRLQQGVMDIDYTIEQVETWGGYVNFDSLFPGESYFNLTGATDITLDYHVREVSDAPGRATFRLKIFDSSDCVELCDTVIANNELHYSFVPILDEARRGHVSLPAISSVQAGQPFWLTGWSGILGNKALDLEYIKGFSLELVLDSQLERGHLVSGKVSFSNVAAARVLEIDEIAAHASCVEEPLLSLYTDTQPFRRVEFVGNRCCEICANDPTCIYGHSNGRDCFIASELEPHHVGVRAEAADEEGIRVFWVDDPTKRGECCDTCTCYKEISTIDCRGADLVVPPVLGNGREENWSPRFIDLRENPRLLVLGSGALSSVASTLEKVWLPQNIKYIADWEAADLPMLQSIEFEENQGGELVTHTGSTGLVNAITQRSEFFQDVCCAPGKRIELGGLTSNSLEFCMFSRGGAGSDSVYEPFMKYIDAKHLETLKASSEFLSEAAESPEKCAGVCDIVDECNFFECDARLPNAEHMCHLLENNGTHTERVCCDKRHCADEAMTTAGLTSGRPPRSRREIDKARVIVPQQELHANEKTNF